MIEHKPSQIERAFSFALAVVHQAERMQHIDEAEPWAASSSG